MSWLFAKRFTVLLFLVICAFFLTVFLTGCQPSKKSDVNSISVWHWMTDRDAAFQELAKRYEAKTGVKVTFELYAPSDAYSQKVRAAAQGDNLPDIFGILGEKRDFSSFIKAGYILDLTPYMEESLGAWKNSFFAKALAVNEFIEGNSYGVKAGIYGAPIDIMTIQMLYNKKLFKELGLNPKKPPQTFAELLEMGQKIKQAKMQGLVSGWGEVWMVDCFASNYAFNIMGKDKVLATIKGEVAYTDPDWIKVLGLFKQMQESGVLANGLVTMINKTAEQLFANDKAVFAFNGSWCVNVYKGMNPDLDYAGMLPPKASEQNPMAIWGGAGSSFMVNGRSKNKEEAVKFLQWLTDRDQQAYLAEITNNLPANKNCLNKIPDILASFAKAMDNATHPNVWGVSEFSPVIEAFDKGIQSIIIGEKTPEQVAAEVQKIKERELAKKRSR
ncbi:MAG: extracellular solute-binding protein [Candidatus Omnitrophica bacterium]|nr:extracellular solute-binding protein [Candidatus Omnitrophota bacterium]MBU1869585.1 extracellular solute-binding protein [Candidatus Omnitrophota bacterium]